MTVALCTCFAVVSAGQFSLSAQKLHLKPFRFFYTAAYPWGILRYLPYCSCKLWSVVSLCSTGTKTVLAYVNFCHCLEHGGFHIDLPAFAYSVNIFSLEKLVCILQLVIIIYISETVSIFQLTERFIHVSVHVWLLIVIKWVGSVFCVFIWSNLYG